MLYAAGHEFGMVLFGTGESGNALNDQDPAVCPNVQTVRTLSKVDLDFFREIQNFTPETEPVDGGSIVDAIEVSLDMLERFCQNRKYRRRIFLITDGEKVDNQATKSRTEKLVSYMQSKDVRMNVITLDFANELGQDDSDEDDEDVENINPNKKKNDVNLNETKAQTKNKNQLLDMVNRIKGAIFPASVAMEVCK